MIKLMMGIFGIIFISSLLVVILARTETNTPISAQQAQHLQAAIDGTTFSH